MNMPFDPDGLADDLMLADDGETPIDEWTIDELERSADLGSLQSAWKADGSFD